MRRALGKGLSQLIAEQFEGTLSEIPVGSIVPNQRQPRSHFDDGALEELAQSIREYGVIQPLLVRPLAEGQYELIAGERRWRASQLAGLTSVPALVRSAGAQNSLELALVENVQRADINALECGRAYRRLIEEFGLTQEQVAERVGKSRAGVANAIRLLKLPNRVQEGLEQGRISEGHARALLALESDMQRLALYERILERGLTVRDVERAARGTQGQPSDLKQKAQAPEKPAAALDVNDAALQDALSVFLGTPTKIVRGEVGGKLVMEFYSDDDLDRVLEQLGFRVD